MPPLPDNEGRLQGMPPDSRSMRPQPVPLPSPSLPPTTPGGESHKQPVPIPAARGGGDATAAGARVPLVADPKRSSGRSGSFPGRWESAARPGGLRDRPAGDEGDQQEDLTDVLVFYAQPWLISAIVHMLLLIVLALIMIPQLMRREIELDAEIYAEKLGDQLEIDSPFAGNDAENMDEPLWTPPDLRQVADPFAAPPASPLVPEGVTSTSDIQSVVIGHALLGRDEGARQALLAAYGGTATTEAAVALGLQWLARQQRRNGSWSLVGPYPNGAQTENPEAATALALLAFQGAGNTHKLGKFRQNVASGWDWLLQQQDADGNFFHEGGFNHRFYTQGLCTIALCEILGMSRDERFREPAERAVDYLIRAQSSEGGWRYSPNVDSDVSVTGWIVMALQSARMAGLKVPPDVFRKVENYLNRVGLEGGSKYPYQQGREATLAMTAEGLLMRQFLGWSHDDPRLVKGVRWITEPANLINFERDRDVYFWYYATQVCHHMEGEAWSRWNGVMRQALPEQQIKTGPQAGSWDPTKPSADAWGSEGGRLYVTCLSIYCLEVYYRHLPLYSPGALRLVSGAAAVPALPAASSPANSGP